MPSAARLGDLHFCAENGPNNAATLMIVKGSPNITINGLPAARVGDMVSCRMSGMSTIAEGSSKVFFNGQPAARTGDSTDNGGSLMAGSSNVIIGDGHCTVMIGNTSQVKFGSQCKIYLSASSASEKPSPPSNHSSTADKWKHVGQMINTGGNILAIAGIPLDEVGVGEVMQVIGGTAKGAGKALELAAEIEQSSTTASAVEIDNAAENLPASEKPQSKSADGSQQVEKEIKQCSDTIAGCKLTKHATQRMNERNVSKESVQDALKNPLKVNPPKTDELGRISQRYIGNEAEVVINPETGDIVSVNPTSTSKSIKLGGGQ